MQNPFIFSPLFLNDAARLRQAHLLPVAHNTLAELREYLRHFLAVCGRGAWLVVDTSGQIQAVAGFQTLDLTGQRAALHLLHGDLPLATACLQAIVKQATTCLGIYRLEIGILPDDSHMLDTAATTGLKNDGCLANGFYDPITKRHHDIMMYSILRPSITGQGSAFVRFSKGVFALTGDDAAITESELVHYGEAIQNTNMREMAELLGLLDAAGLMLDRIAIQKRFADEIIMLSPEAPEIIAHAARQIAAYFSGSLKIFDIAVNLAAGSEFQRKVWRKLAEIPFGTTWTYEELAHSLTQGDWPAARKMARAVGAACSANPLPLILPCHRVIGKDGRLVGFSSGLDMKEYLLAHEMMGINE